MTKKISVRYGRNYKVVLAIVLPCFLIAPFIWLMQKYAYFFKEWEVWVLIFTFLASLIWFIVWLALMVYPKTVLSINRDDVSLSFDPNNFFSPRDFRFNISDITSFTKHEINGDEYFLFETKNPTRKFQISSYSYEIGNFISFNEAMVEISEKTGISCDANM